MSFAPRHGTPCSDLISKTYTFTLDDNPFFCIPLHFISLAQHDDALEELPNGSRLTSEQLLAMSVRTGLKSQPIPFRKDMKDKPLFRMTYEQLNHFLKRLGIETGFVQIFTSYCIRRASGNAVNGKQSILCTMKYLTPPRIRRPHGQRCRTELGYGSHRFQDFSTELPITNGPV